MHQDGIQAIEEWFLSHLRQVCANVQVFWIPHNLKSDQEDSKILLRLFGKQSEKISSLNTD